MLVWPMMSTSYKINVLIAGETQWSGSICDGKWTDDVLEKGVGSKAEHVYWRDTGEGLIGRCQVGERIEAKIGDDKWRRQNGAECEERIWRINYRTS